MQAPSYEAVNPFSDTIPQASWALLSSSFAKSGCGSHVVTPYNGTTALFEASKSTQRIYDAVMSGGVIYIACPSDVGIALEWIADHSDSTKTSIRSGGNSFGGYNKANDHVIVDVSSLNDISSITDEIVSVEPGVSSVVFGV